MTKLTNEEIKAALRKCAALEDCHGCVIWDRCHGQMIACTAAAERIEALEAKIAKAVEAMKALGAGSELCNLCAKLSSCLPDECGAADYRCENCESPTCQCRVCSNGENFEWEADDERC